MGQEMTFKTAGVDQIECLFYVTVYCVNKSISIILAREMFTRRNFHSCKTLLRHFTNHKYFVSFAEFYQRIIDFEKKLDRNFTRKTTTKKWGTIKNLFVKLQTSITFLIDNFHESVLIYIKWNYEKLIQSKAKSYAQKFTFKN